MKRKALWVGVITAVHAVLTIGAVLVTMSLAMSAFDGKRESGVADRVSTLLTGTLMSPLGPVYQIVTPRGVQTPALLDNVVMLLNSFLWGLAIVWLVERRSLRRAALRSAAADGR